MTERTPEQSLALLEKELDRLTVAMDRHAETARNVRQMLMNRTQSSMECDTAEAVWFLLHLAGLAFEQYKEMRPALLDLKKQLDELESLIKCRPAL